MKGKQTEISVLYLRSLIEYLENQNVSLNDFLISAGYPPDLMDNFEAWVPVDTIHHLWEFASEFIKDPDIGLHVGEKATIGRWGLVEYLALNSGSLREIVENASKYWRLLFNGEKSIILGKEKKLATLSFFSKNIRCRFFYEADLVYSIRLIQQVLSQNFYPTEVRLVHEATELAEYHRIFGDRISFNHSTYSMLFPYNILDQPLPKSNPVLMSILSEHASGVMADMLGKITLAEKVEQIIQINLPHISINRVAEHLYLSVRTLQRKLKLEKKSFREILDDARKKKAHGYLIKNNTSLGEVAFLLGFSEPSAFNQAVKRWFGMTPGNYRIKNL